VFSDKNQCPERTPDKFVFRCPFRTKLFCRLFQPLRSWLISDAPSEQFCVGNRHDVDNKSRTCNLSFVKSWKKILLSFFIGGLVTALIYFYNQIPSNGPRIFTIIFEIPFMLIAMASENLVGRFMSDCIFYGLQIAFYAVLTFLALSIFRKTNSKS
jgi:hypothetical protein